MSAALMTGVSMSVSAEALAGQNTFEDYVGGTSAAVSSPFANTVAFICYMGGFALAALGVVGLKQHVENPGQAPMKNGLAKLGFGGMLMALPPVVSAIQGSALEGGNTDTGLNQFGTDSL